METSKSMTDAATAGADAGYSVTPAELEYRIMRSELRVFAKNGNLSAQSMGVFTICRVLLNQEEGEDESSIEDRAVKKLTKAFTPVTNETKLANGRRRWDTLINVLDRITIAKDYGQFSHPSESLVEMLKAITPRLRVAVRGLKFTTA